MATCSACHEDMSVADTCAANVVVTYKDGSTEPGRPYDPAPSAGPEKRCHDCNVTRGSFHHPGCDMEICPRCDWPIVSCECAFSGDEDETEDEED